MGGLGNQCRTNSDCNAGMACEGYAASFYNASSDRDFPETMGTCVIREAAAPPDPNDAFVITPVQPKINIALPNLSFKQLQVENDDGGKYITVPWIAQYIAAVYRWAVPFGAVLAVIIMMIGGMIWMTSGATGSITKAEGMITNAAIGLILLVGSYFILNLVNPDLVRLTALRVDLIARENLTLEEEPEEVNGQVSGDIVEVAGTNIKNIPSKDSGPQTIDRTLLSKLNVAAFRLSDDGIELWVTSGYRSEEKQRALITKNCDDPKNSKSCKPPTCMLYRGPQSCPHTTGNAIDVWGAKNGRQCISQRKCDTKNPANDPCRQNDCQAKVIQAMRAAGFCNWQREAWHFESTPMSNPCT
ncbi:MAG: D-alanyl-D-alanine carboxypeptidase family protein [bacterium]|nr:D-alanyl-D-alanine carboxypeptidase family protein [bacterium]